MIRTACLLALVGALLSSEARVVEACSCTRSEGIKAEMAESAAVFKGIVVSVTPAEPAGIVQARFKVLRLWKGEASPELLVRTGTRMCHLTFAVGDRWLVFAHGEPLFSGMCSKSGHRSLSRRGALSDATLEALGKPTEEHPEGSEE